MNPRTLRRYWNRYRLHAVLVAGIVIGLGYLLEGVFG